LKKRKARKEGETNFGFKKESFRTIKTKGGDNHQSQDANPMINQRANRAVGMFPVVMMVKKREGKTGQDKNQNETGKKFPFFYFRHNAHPFKKILTCRQTPNCHSFCKSTPCESGSILPNAFSGEASGRPSLGKMGRCSPERPG